MTNVIKFQAPFERIKIYNSSPEVSLNKAIITQAIIDATNISSNKLAKKYEIEAKAWIFGGSEDFRLVCNNANMEPSFVVKLTKEIAYLHRKNNASRKTLLNKISNSNAKKIVKSSNLSY